MSEQFVVKLEQLLNQFQITKEEKKEIVDDYKQMVEDGKEKGLNEQEIIDMVGTPEKIIRELGLKKKERIPGGSKLIALSPFVSFIIFMILGFTKDLWHPGWLVFLLIPMTAIIVEMLNSRDKHMLTALSPFISGLIYLGIGFFADIWHPTWLIFSIIPMSGIINSRDEMDKLTLYTAISPFISFITFFIIGYFTGAYHLAWLVFLLVIFFGILHANKLFDKILMLVALGLSIGLYVFIGLNHNNWVIASFSFILFIAAGMITNEIKIGIFDEGDSIVDKIIVLISLILFLCVGYFFELWAISWLCLFIIPVAMIIKYSKKDHLFTALSPFISLAIFILLGYFYDLWHIAWIALLLIPIVAIVEEK